MNIRNLFRGDNAPQYEDIPSEMSAAAITQKQPAQRITKADIEKAAELLKKYKDGKANLENRVVEDEQWWKLNHWEVL
ncbi:MAG: hypothetical protein IKY46_07900, partial [Clostridia bacterium]|nr:hypothetical protein [Clostridia bacterium]MBR5903836.1 hypothetical protein [Clostridia bacterium]